MISDARLLHTMLRVRDLDASLDFYVDRLGMRLLRRQDFPDGQFTLAFVGYGDEDETAVIELTYNWDERDYTLGTAFGHIAIGVADIFASTRDLDRQGVKIVRPAGPLKGDESEMIAEIIYRTTGLCDLAGRDRREDAARRSRRCSQLRQRRQAGDAAAEQAEDDGPDFGRYGVARDAVDQRSPRRRRARRRRALRRRAGSAGAAP